MNKKSVTIPGNGFDPEKTFFCGQTFLWRRAGGSYAAAIDGNAAVLRENGGDYILEWNGGVDESFWHRYFDLGRDYDAISAGFCGDARVKGAFELCRGLRVLNQPVWETVFCFIISANNNDKRIRLCVERAANALGERVDIQGIELMRLPAPEEVLEAGEEVLRALGMGYRAAYLAKTAGMIVSGEVDITDLREIGYESAVKRLMRLAGVGRKVADCILLFSCGYSGAFPVDVWVDRTMRAMYGFSGGRDKLARFGMDLYGDCAGIVQQMLFHAARTGELELNESEDAV